HAVDEADLLRVTALFAAMPVQPVDAAAEAGQRIEPELRVGADRVPGVAEPCGAAQRRAALAADPDRHPLLHRTRLEKDVRELDVFAVEFGVLVAPQLAAGQQILVGDGAAFLERIGAERLEFLAAPAGADPER